MIVLAAGADNLARLMQADRPAPIMQPQASPPPGESPPKG